MLCFRHIQQLHHLGRLSSEFVAPPVDNTYFVMCEVWAGPGFCGKLASLSNSSCPMPIIVHLLKHIENVIVIVVLEISIPGISN